MGRGGIFFDRFNFISSIANFNILVSSHGLHDPVDKVGVLGVNTWDPSLRTSVTPASNDTNKFLASFLHRRRSAAVSLAESLPPSSNQHKSWSLPQSLRHLGDAALQSSSETTGTVTLQDIRQAKCSFTEFPTSDCTICPCRCVFVLLLEEEQAAQKLSKLQGLLQLQ